MNPDRVDAPGGVVSDFVLRQQEEIELDCDVPVLRRKMWNGVPYLGIIMSALSYL